MVAKYVSEGKTIDYTATKAIAAGDVVSRGYLFGVAIRPIAEGETGALAITGIYELPKKASEVVAIGDQICWKDGKAQKHAADGDQPAGVAVAASPAEQTTVLVKIG